MTAPDFIWAWDDTSVTCADQGFKEGGWTDEPCDEMDWAFLYVRRDPAVLADLPEVQAMLREERNNALREAAFKARELWEDGTPPAEVANSIFDLIQEAPHDPAHIAIEERGE